MPRGVPRFLDVDVDVESREPLHRLADALPLVVLVTTRIRHKYVMSLEGTWPALSLDQTLRRLTKMISALSGEPLRLWRRASKRSFNIGIVCGSGRAPPFSIASATIEGVAAVGGGIELTLYPR